MRSNSPDWQSFSIHYYDYLNSDKLIYNVCSKIKSELKNTVIDYFYNRLFDPGPVIKLRLRFAKDIDNYKVQSIISSEVAKHVQKKINKELFMNEYLGDYSIINNKVWPEDGTVYIDKYDRELGRYGDEATMQLAEKFFYYSTLLCVDFMGNENTHWTNKVLFAIKLDSIILKNLGMNRKEIKNYLEGIAEGWMNYVSKKTITRFNIEDLIKEVAKDLIDVDILNVDNGGKDAWNLYNQSIIDIRNYVKGNKIKCKAFPDDSETMKNFIKDYNSDFYFPRIAISLMHMNHNRLGIYLFAEPILYYTMANLVRNFQNG